MIFESPLADVVAASDTVDCLVIGSGTAGVSTALLLAERGYRVVVLEAGPLRLISHIGNATISDGTGLASKLSDATTIPTQWMSSKEAAAGVRVPPVPAWVGVGGRTVFWTGTAPRYKSWDFDDWPIGPDDMTSYYDQAESVMRVSGTGGERPPFYQSTGQRQAIDRLTAAGLPARPTPVGIDTHSARHLGSGFDSSVRRLLASSHLGAFAEGALVSLVAQVVAANLRIDRGRVAGVDVLDRRTGQTFLLHPRHVVLAAGAVQSARLALSSGIDKLSPLVGHYINDHLFVQSTAEFPTATTDANMNIMMDATRERAFHLQIQGPFSGTWYHQSNSTMWVNCNPEGTHMMLAAFGVGSVEKDNRIVLDQGGPKGGYGGMQGFRVIYDRTARDERRLAEMEEMLGRAATIMGSTPGKTQVNPPGGALHEIGGLRMGENAESGVTDTHGRFWRVENLSAADASVFPSQGSANPYLTITAWSLRHADALARSLGKASTKAADAA